jgi:hypothetical protein
MTYFLGSRAYDFTDEQTGRRITGVSVHFANSDENGAIGLIPFKATMTQEAYNKVFGTETASIAAMVAKPVQVAFNEKGKPVSIAPAQAPKA